MNTLLINWFDAGDKYESYGRVVYTGPSPFTFDKESSDDMSRFYKMAWVISHAETRDKLWRVVAVESFCVRVIQQGTPIGIAVEECK